MGLMDWGKAQFLDILEWLDDSTDTLAWRFPMRGQEIQNGGQLVVRESQEAVFVNEGQMADVFKPGTHRLTTQNLPILATLKGWKYGFESPFKSDVYFISTKLYNDLKWGTSNPIMMRDADFGMLRIRAFGIYSLKVVDSATFLRQLVGTNGVYTVPDISEQLRKTIMSRFTDILGEAKIPALDLAAKYDEISDLVRQKLQEEFKTMGLELSKFFVENISLPEEVEAMMDKRTGVGMMAPVMGAYTQMQVADAIPLAAQNPGGVAGMGMGVGLGFGMGNMMGQQMAGAQQQMGQQGFTAGSAPAAGAPAKSLKEELTELKELFDGQLINQAEYDAQRAVIMKKHGMGQ
ncbi:MAG: SPFH domain-containing protein [Geothrix sp.]|jgi:membrane protease subunit (stomatin/prohibitin family)|uniref:SPFH domain-containing protein n=1 Tax=Candidatus Geothrix odensensis TaxID=2954440 RepID=A0A936K7C6_9BACT|nr:SPFH domain-containing protein [Candidatus Geothrix odensensis]MBP7618959.1 SPFH domain-containing protein [Geothrix sp.]